MPPHKVLFPILNWGLGHATRSLPIIRLLQLRGHDVTIASDGDALFLLRQELPEIPYLKLPSYQITYPLKANLAARFRLAKRIANAISSEHKFAQRIFQQHNFDLVISDNRYGLYHTDKPSILITHQISLPLKGLQRWAANRTLRSYIDKFDTCWIPDDPALNLSGALSEGAIGIPKRRIGILSRLHPSSTTHSSGVLAILSGPEPQRTFFQEELVAKLSQLDSEATIVLGTTNAKHIPKTLPDHITCHSILTADKLGELICESELVICRSGYSSIMDLTRLGKSALLVPTPGQPEQEYLGQHLATSRQFLVQKQGEIDIISAHSGLRFGGKQKTSRGEDLIINALQEQGL